MITTAQIESDVRRGLELRDRKRQIDTELKAIESRLEKAGLQGPHIPLQEEDREGKQFLAKAGDLVVPVIFEADQLIATIRPGSETAAAAKQAAGDALPKFYRAETTLVRVPKDGQAFRRLARELLGASGPKLVHACLQRDKQGIPKSRTIIAWDAAKPLAEIAS
jgi:hypothetical protein